MTIVRILKSEIVMNSMLSIVMPFEYQVGNGLYLI